MEDKEEKCCVECFDDYTIKEFIEACDEKGNCDFCGSINIHIASVDYLKTIILEGIDRKYKNAADGVPVESGEYQWPTTDIHTILSDEEVIFSCTVLSWCLHL